MYAQATIFGFVKDTNNTPIISANIIIQTNHDSIIRGFGFTDANGYYKTNLNSIANHLTIQVSHLGFESKILDITNKSQEINFNLVHTNEKLKEVVIKSPPPISFKNDTLNYNINAFKTKTDRVISDILNRIPGIEIATNGRIYYQGVPIEKYYIEGLDLLEGKYNLANNNLPANAVKSIQVLENHQPIKILDSLIFNPRASINLTLKDDIVITGNAEIGIGAPPFLWDINLTPMVFSKNKQAIVSYQTNNTGSNAANDLQTLTIDNINDIINKKEIEIINPQKVKPPPFSSNMWLNNNIHLLSANHLFPLKKGYELKLNLAYFNDLQEQTNTEKRNIYTLTDTIKTKEISLNTLHKNNLDTKIVLLKNSKKTYIKNKTHFNAIWDAIQNKVTYNSSPVNEKAKLPTYTLNNTLEGILPFGKQLVQFSTQINFNTLPQNLVVHPGQFLELTNQGNTYDAIKQQTKLNSFYTNNNLYIIKAFGSFKIQPELSFKFSHEKLTSNVATNNTNIYTTLNETFSNNIRLKNSEIGFGLKTYFTNGNLKLSYNLPIYINSVGSSDYILTTKEKLNKFIFTPSFRADYKINSHWKTNFSGAFSYKNGALDNLYSGYILTNYRNIGYYNTSILEKHYQNYKFKLAYKNPIKSLFFHVQYYFIRNKSNLIYNTVFDVTGAATTITLKKDNITRNHRLSSKISKFIAPIKGNFNIGTTFEFSNTVQYINSQLTPLNTYTKNINSSMSSTVFNWLNLDASANLIMSHLKTNATTNKVVTQNYEITIKVFPSANSYITLNNEFFKSKMGLNNNEPNSIFNLKCNYTFLKNKIDLQLMWNNILNEKTFTNVYNNTNMVYSNTFNLRPSQVIIKSIFNF